MQVFVYRRFSSDEQESGDSLARQSRVCAAFAQSRSWTVLGEITDRGRSAFKGEHLSEGELGKFIARLEAGEIEPGTVLLAEKLDRLSRRPVAEAMAWLHRVTSLGLQVAIADKGKVFGANLSFEDFFTSALSLATANEESSKKSDRIHSARLRAWAMAERREHKWVNLATRPPLWLSRAPDCASWIVDEERAALIRDIYQWSADGLGAVTIAARLNAIPVKPWGVWRKHGDTWSRTSIRQLLLNPAVEGDYTGEVGMFAGRTLHGFYPRIVDALTVSQARAQHDARRKFAGRRVSSGSTNLFAGLTVCGECGKPAHMTTHVKKGRTYRYLRCEGAPEGRSCYNRSYYAYDAFEHAALDLCLDLALDDRYFAVTGDLREAKIKVAELAKAISDRRSARARLLGFLEEGDSQVEGRIRALKGEIETLEGQFAEAKTAADRASGKVGAVEHLRRVNDIRDAAASDDPRTRDQARAKLRQALGAIINSVEVGRSPDGPRVFTIAFLGGVMAVRIDTEGKVVAGVSEVHGHHLSEYLTPEQRVVAEPLLRRIDGRLAA